jgi:hypothetical protein
MQKNANLGMKNPQKLLFLRSTLTTSSTFPQFNSKMSPLGNKNRKLQ